MTALLSLITIYKKYVSLRGEGQNLVTTKLEAEQYLGWENTWSGTNFGGKLRVGQKLGGGGGQRDKRGWEKLVVVQKGIGQNVVCGEWEWDKTWDVENGKTWGVNSAGVDWRETNLAFVKYRKI